MKVAEFLEEKSTSEAAILSAAVPKLSLFARSDCNGRENNEDSFLVFKFPPLCVVETGEPEGKVEPEDVWLLVVADGMGGHEGGEWCSAAAVRAFAAALSGFLLIAPCINDPDARQPDAVEHCATSAAIGQAMRAAVREANREVRHLRELRTWTRAGTTLVAALVVGAKVFVTNLGDSLLFCYRAASDSLEQVTEAHNVAGTLLRNGLITSEMARVHEGRSQLQLYLGMDELPDSIPVATFELTTGDRLLLGSDGAYGELEPDELKEIVGAAGESLEDIAHTLLARTRYVGETDNQTVVFGEYCS